MRYHRRHGWEIPVSETTPEAIFLNRRAFVAGAGALAASVALPPAARADVADPTISLYPAKRDDAFKLDRDVTPEKPTSTTIISTSSAPASTSRPMR